MQTNPGDRPAKSPSLSAASPAAAPSQARQGPIGPRSEGSRAPAASELPKQYKPSEHEGKVRERWEASGAFHADPRRVLEDGSRPYAIVIPPPNVTDRLHLGHALNNTLQDVLTRAHRMMGYETLWMPGTDHAGIATQTVVERRVLKEEGKRRTDFKREEFVAKIQAFKDEYEAVITGQLKAMGCSCDWQRQRFTMDEGCIRAVNEAFFRLFRDGLIYRGKRLVNWDPVTQTALSDDEVEMEEVDGKFYYLRYPLVNAMIRGGIDSEGVTQRFGDDREDTYQSLVPVTWSELRARGYPVPDDAAHADEKQAFITVATTRPETYLGDTAVAINPRDPRAGALRGLLCELPLVGRIIPIIEDDYVVMPRKMAEALGDPEAAADPKAEFATGFLKVTPAHDPNDYELGLRHDLAQINVMAPDASISDHHGWTDIGDAHIFVGKSREEARELVVKEFHARGLVADIKPYRHSIGHSYRSHAAIEPYLSDQWYVRVTDPKLRDAALRALVDDQRTSPSAPRSASVPLAQPTHQPTPPKRWNSMPVGDTLRAHFRRLPHFQKGGSTYFVTARLLSGTLSEPERQIVLDAIFHWHDKRAHVHLAVVMPDHVHILLTPLQERPGEWWQLGQLMHSIKSFTSHEISRRRGTSGQLWQHDNYDHIIRDEDDFLTKWGYILENPVRKQLVHRSGDYLFIARTDVGYLLQHGTERFRAYMEGRFDEAKPLEDPSSEAPDDPLRERDARATPSMQPEGRSSGDGRLRFHPDRYARTYETWHVNIRDWCISRQLWWGHRIPVWTKILDFSTEDAGTEVFELAVKGNAWQESHVEYFDAKSGEKLAHTDAMIHGWADCEAICFACLLNPADAPKWEARGWQRDPDVLDTWFSSALWPMSTMGWPEETPLLQSFNPTNVLCTAREIITLWVSRMVMFNRYFRGQDLERGPGNGPLPFRDVFIHAMIQDGEGRKMSKSLGNGLDPLDIIHSHGADAMRFTLCKMTTQTQDVRMPVERDPATGKNTSAKFDEGRNFCNKLWNATRFALTFLDPSAASASRTQDAGPRPQDPTPLSLPDRWILSRLLAAAKTINLALERYEYSDYATTLYDLLWRDFCDWYLEAIKPTVAANPRQRAVLAHTLEAIIRFLHPIAPFITEAIFEHLREVETEPVKGINMGRSRIAGLLATAGWPVIESHLHDEEAEQQFEQVRAIVTAIREVRAQHNIPPKRRITLHLPAALDLGEGADLVKTLAGLDQITTAPPTPPAAAFLAAGTQFHLSNLAEAVDASAEITRLEKTIADRDKTITTLQGRLSNPGYADKAPPAMVQQTRDQLAKATQERDAAAMQLAQLQKRGS